MQVLIGCETSGAMRRAFRALGHDAYSCDLLPADDGSPFHFQEDVFGVAARQPWDLLVAHPSCTYLCASGIHWNARRPERAALTDAAVDDVRRLWALPIEKVAIENPIGVLSTRWMRPTQIVQPYDFGHDARKATCFWLRNLEPLQPTQHVLPQWACRGCRVRVAHHVGKDRCPRCGGPVRPVWANQTVSGQNALGPSATRWKVRSATYAGIAAAAAATWGGPILGPS